MAVSWYAHICVKKGLYKLYIMREAQGYSISGSAVLKKWKEGSPVSLPEYRNTPGEKKSNEKQETN